MTDFAVLYKFHRLDALSLKRLRRLVSMNPELIFVPCFGVRQFLYIPLVRDFQKRYWTNVNKFALKSSHIFRLSSAINRKLGTFSCRSELEKLRAVLERNGLSLYCDFTPMAYGLNADRAILQWFDTAGRMLPFDYLVYYEYDMYATKKIRSIYGEYVQHDAAFVLYERAASDWFYYSNPPGARRLTLKWLKRRGLDPVLYRSLFAGNMISRKALEALVHLKDLPYCHCEMRMPTVLTALGFKCGRLDFPMVRYRPPISRNEIENRTDAGIFHPVYEHITEGNSPA